MEEGVDMMMLRNTQSLSYKADQLKSPSLSKPFHLARILPFPWFNFWIFFTAARPSSSWFPAEEEKEKTGKEGVNILIIKFSLHQWHMKNLNQQISYIKKIKKIKINVYSNDLPLFAHGKIKGAVVWS